MKVKVAEWKAFTQEERFWLLESEAFRQWKARNQKGVIK
jgi:hypothetical protein